MQLKGKGTYMAPKAAFSAVSALCVRDHAGVQPWPQPTSANMKRRITAKSFLLGMKGSVITQQTGCDSS